MNPVWLVCVKQVLQDPVFKKAGESFQMDRERAEGILNPCDRFALELARSLRSRAGGFVVVMTMGPPMAEEALREALALGADRAILLSDPDFAGADTLATARTLAAAARKIGAFDLVLCGARTLDSDTGQVGPQLAEFLDLPMAARVDTVVLRGSRIHVERRIDGMRERLAIRLPALITVEGQSKWKEAVSLRSLEQVFREVPVSRWSREDLGIGRDRVGWAGSATQARQYALLERKRSGDLLEVGAAEAAQRILDTLLEKNILGR